MEESIFDLVSEEEKEKMLGASKPKKNRATIGVATTLLRLREEPSTDADILYMIPEGNAVAIVGESGEFYNVMVEGLIGYCMKEFVKV